MKIDLISDIHLEFKNFKLTTKGEILIIAGDVGPVAKINAKYKSFFKNASNNYKHVIFVSGNHEYHGSKINRAEKLIDECFKEFKNVYFLQCNKITINEYEFYGCTLWSNLLTNSWLTNDGASIENLSIKKFKDMHQKHKKWLDEQLSIPRNKNIKRIVITHYLPSLKCIHNKYKVYGKEANSFYASDCEEIVRKSDLWLFGHTHISMNIKLDNIRMICNPRGYPWETSENYIPEIIDI